MEVHPWCTIASYKDTKLLKHNRVSGSTGRGKTSNLNMSTQFHFLYSAYFHQKTSPLKFSRYVLILMCVTVCEQSEMTTCSHSIHQQTALVKDPLNESTMYTSAP